MNFNFPLNFHFILGQSRDQYKPILHGLAMMRGGAAVPDSSSSCFSSNTSRAVAKGSCSGDLIQFTMLLSHCSLQHKGGGTEIWVQWGKHSTVLFGFGTLLNLLQLIDETRNLTLE